MYEKKNKQKTKQTIKKQKKYIYINFKKKDETIVI